MSDPISIATGVITFAQLFCSVTSVANRYRDVPQILENICDDCKSTLDAIYHTSNLLFGRRESQDTVWPPTNNVEQELAIRISKIHDSVRSLLERIQRLITPTERGGVRLWKKLVKGRVHLRHLEDEYTEIKERMAALDQLMNTWNSAMLYEMWRMLNEINRRLSTTSTASGTSVATAASTASFEALPATPTSTSSEASLATAASENVRGPRPNPQHSMDSRTSRTVSCLTESQLMEGRLALIKLIQDLPLDSDNPQSNNARRQGLSIIKALICAGNIQPDFRTDDEERLSPIHLAFQKRDPDLLALLIECGASLATRDNRGDTVLHIATKNDDLDMVKTLLSDEIKGTPRRIENSRERANKLDSRGRPALWWAAARGSSREVFEYLLTLGPEVVNFQCEDEDFPTALWAAASKGQLDTARALLRNGADPMIRDRNQSTLLHMANWPNMAHRIGSNAADPAVSPGLYTYLLRHPNIDAAARDRAGRQPIHFAAAAGEVAMCRALLDHLRRREILSPQQTTDTPHLVDARDNNSATPLMYAAGTGQIRVVRMLIAERADVRAVDRYGSDAFAVACDRGFLTTAAFLLGAYPERDLDKRNRTGETALERAQRNGHTEVVNWLVELGAGTE